MQFMMVQGSKSRVRRDEMRLIVAHIHRLVAADLKPGILQEDTVLRSKFIDWILDTLKYLQATAIGQYSPGKHEYNTAMLHWTSSI